MMRRHLCLTLLVLAAAPARAQDDAPPPITRQAFKLDPETGCYRYVGNAMEFVGRFRAGSYIGVTMQTLDANGLAVPPEQEDRMPSTDAPDWKTDAPGFWFGPLPQSRDYVFTFSPRYLFGSMAAVSICGRTTPPSGTKE